MHASSPILALLAGRLSQGGFTLGQVAITPLAGAKAELRHVDDQARPAAELETFADALMALGEAR